MDDQPVSGEAIAVASPARTTRWRALVSAAILSLGALGNVYALSVLIQPVRSARPAWSPYVIPYALAMKATIGALVLAAFGGQASARGASWRTHAAWGCSCCVAGFGLCAIAIRFDLVGCFFAGLGVIEPIGHSVVHVAALSSILEHFPISTAQKHCNRGEESFVSSCWSGCCPAICGNGWQPLLGASTFGLAVSLGATLFPLLFYAMSQALPADLVFVLIALTIGLVCWPFSMGLSAASPTVMAGSASAPSTVALPVVTTSVTQPSRHLDDEGHPIIIPASSVADPRRDPRWSEQLFWSSPVTAPTLAPSTSTSSTAPIRMHIAPPAPQDERMSKRLAFPVFLGPASGNTGLRCREMAAVVCNYRTVLLAMVSIASLVCGYGLISINALLFYELGIFETAKQPNTPPTSVVSLRQAAVYAALANLLYAIGRFAYARVPNCLGRRASVAIALSIQVFLVSILWLFLTQAAASGVLFYFTELPTPTQSILHIMVACVLVLMAAFGAIVVSLPQFIAWTYRIENAPLLRVVVTCVHGILSATGPLLLVFIHYCSFVLLNGDSNTNNPTTVAIPARHYANFFGLVCALSLTGVVALLGITSPIPSPTEEVDRLLAAQY